MSLSSYREVIIVAISFVILTALFYTETCLEKYHGGIEHGRHRNRPPPWCNLQPLSKVMHTIRFATKLCLATIAVGAFFTIVFLYLVKLLNPNPVIGRVRFYTGNRVNVLEITRVYVERDVVAIGRFPNLHRNAVHY